MLSDIPKNLSKVRPEDIDREILRVGMIAELDAVNLYEQMAAMAKDKNIKRIYVSTHLSPETRFKLILNLLSPDQNYGDQTQRYSNDLFRIIGLIEDDR